MSRDRRDLAGRPAEVAIPELLAEHGGQIYALGLRFCGNRAEAEDVVQETFLQAWRGWDRFEGRSKPSTWLYTIAARACRRMHRKRAGEPEHVPSLEELLPFDDASIGIVPDEDEETPLDEQIRREGRERIEAAITALPADFRMPLVLKEIVGFSVAEVAEILGVKEATVKTRLHRARLKLRHALEHALPRREVPPPRYDEQMCMDFLLAKQESLDRGVSFDFPEGFVCERCEKVFATMDLAQDLCAELHEGRLPDEVREKLHARLAETT